MDMIRVSLRENQLTLLYSSAINVNYAKFYSVMFRPDAIYVSKELDVIQFMFEVFEALEIIPDPKLNKEWYALTKHIWV